MKKILLLSSVLVAAAAFAQTTDSYRLNLKLVNGQSASFKVEDIEEITFDEDKPITLAVDQTKTDSGRTYTTDEDGVTVVYWDTTAPEHAIRTVSFDGDGCLTGYDYVVTFSYWSENPVSNVELRMVQNGSLLFPWKVGDNMDLAHCVRPGSDTSSQGGEWKELTFDVSRAWEIVEFNQSKNRLQDLCIQIDFRDYNTVAQTFKVKDFHILPRVAESLPEVALPYTSIGEAYGRTVSDIEGGFKVEFPGQYQAGDGSMANIPAHEVWVKAPYVLPNCDYTLSFSYKVDTDIKPIRAYLFHADFSAADGGTVLDEAPVKDQWKEIKVNMKDAFTALSYWGVKQAGELIRLDINPVADGTPINIEIKDAKLVPNP